MWHRTLVLLTFYAATSKGHSVESDQSVLNSTTLVTSAAPAPAATSWYVVQTKARAEQKAAGFLVRKAVSTFLPLLLVRRRHGSRRWYALEPLFPGYLFARFVPVARTVDHVRWTPGVRRLLGDGEAPVPVPDDVVQYLQERQGQAGFITPGQPLRPGMSVRFRHGPFELLEGIIERPASQPDRVRVLLTLVHGVVAVEAPVDDLEQA